MRIADALDQLALQLDRSVGIANQLQQANVRLKTIKPDFNQGCHESKLMFHMLNSLKQFHADVERIGNLAA